MVNVKILKTGEIRQVTRNVAHDLIERGLAKLTDQTTKRENLDRVDSTETTNDALNTTAPFKPETASANGVYANKQMRPTQNK